MSNETAIASLKEKIDDLNQHAWEVRVTDLPKSFELSQESVKLSRSINYTKGLAEGLRSLGFSYVRFSKNDEAAPLLKESLSLFQSLNDLKGQAVIYEYLGIIERNWGNLGASLDLLLKANELVLQIDSQEIEITCSYQLGVTYKHLGDHENALDYLYKTLSLAKKMNFTLMEAYATNIIGSIYFDNGNYNEALDLYQQGLIIRRQSHDKWGEAGSLDNIGFTYLKLNDLDKAIDHCKQSLAICQATGDKKGEANALLHLGEIYEQAGDIKQAADFSNKSLEIRRERGDKRGETEVLLFLAELYKNRNDVEDHQIFKWLTNALKIADEVKAQDLLSKTHYNLHEYYQQKGNFKESLVQLEAHFQIEKELHKNSINQKIANLEISHKAEVVSQRNKELTELNEKIEKANEELKIEASLERVRSRSMAMHKSDELREVVAVLFAQLQHIGFDIKFCTIALIDKVNSTVEFWLSGFSQEILPESYHVPNLDHPFYQNFQNTFRQGIPYKVFELAGEEKRSYDKLWFTLTDFKNLPEPVKKPMMEMERVVLSCAFTKNGMIQIGGFESLSNPDASTVQRFAKVFEQTYTRFLDLQKAEAQAREAQIQLAMERVRARTMAMQRSEELAEVATLLFQQVKALGVSQWVCGFSIWEIGDNEFTWYPGGPDGEILAPCKVPLTEHPVFISMNESRLRGDELFVYEKEGELQADHYRYMISIPGMRKQLQNFLDAGLSIPTFQIDHIANFSHGNLTFITYEHFPEMHDIFKRFAKVFEQTYTRFLDLQKAEAQAREAQIEAALERVRSKTMAMQRSEELDSVIKSVYSELKHLDVSFDRCFIMIFDEQKGATWWMGSPEDDLFHEGFYVQYHTHPPHLAYLKGWEERQQKWEYLLGGQIKKDWDEFIFNKTELSKLPPIAIQYMKSFDSAHLAASFENFGCMTTGGQERLSEESFSILSRFAKVFDQTYTRFNDLKQAEAQARESQIEAALEKIRSRSLAMHHSKELKEVIAITFEKLNELNVLPGTVAIQLFDKKSMHSVLWVGNTIQDPQMVDLPYDKQMMLEDTLLKDGWQAMIEGIDIINKEYSVEQKNKYFNYLFSNNSLTQIPEQAREVLRQMDRHIVCLFVEKNSAFLVDSWKGEFFPKENLHVLKRAAKVFEQAYIRFLDLQKAEAQAREAQIEAALERVRSRTMGMQKSEELKDVIQVVYEQFVHLNINIEHTGFVMDYKARDDYDIWIADQLGVPSHLIIPYFDCIYYNRFNEAKKNGEDFFATNLDFEEKNLFYQKLFEYVPGLTEEAKKFYFSCPGLAASTVLLDNVCLYIENFAGTPYTDEENATLMRFGKVFQQTYTRFNDLKLAEALAVQAKEDLVKLQTEKKRAEDALSELQVTQKQLIQSEKMASLGELTAGIAHEIQNPLNFVNNFSDVNKELLIEMKEEIEKGNLEEVKVIANDIISNEEKINHHGKRADAIVKGMLQHSRSSSGVKEPTDINELADEYLRLAYHGLRAKDKSFNATMKTDFDEKIGKVNVIPQEIGRVFLNLITNAFYVVAEKKKQMSPSPKGGNGSTLNDYEPIVTVTTKRLDSPSGGGGKVLISVKDNGNGIPQKVLDKIFQPFFTTKPTGQGTGLGLSLSYDIVKAHSGEIKVKTKDGEGSEFVIQLPIDQ